MTRFVVILLTLFGCEKEQVKGPHKITPVAEHQAGLEQEPDDDGPMHTEDKTSDLEDGLVRNNSDRATELFKMRQVNDMQNLAKKELEELAASSQSSSLSSGPISSSGGSGAGTHSQGKNGPVVGSGSGSGWSVGIVPLVRPGWPVTVKGNLDQSIIMRYVRRKLPKITDCYEKELLVRPGLGGKLGAHFRIDAHGVVVQATASGVDARVATCVAGVIKAIKFPKPKGSYVEVDYSFRMTPPSK